MTPDDTRTSVVEAFHSRCGIPAPRPRRPVEADGVTEIAVATSFAVYHAASLRFCHTAQAWFMWDGAGWARDETGHAIRLAREACRRAADALPSGRERTSLGRASAVSAVERLARADERLAVSSSAWDRDPWRLGTPGGTVDLRTGELMASRREDLITRRTAVAPAPPGTPCPVWTAFLREATGNDADLTGFLQRLVGYAATGDTSEEMLAFLYGEGGGGKGTFIGAVAAVLGTYAVAVPLDLFTAASRLPSPYYFAMLAGARLATASETESGARWAESLLKEVSGNETAVSARHPHGRPFTYRPTFKVLMIGNHAPTLKGRTHAMERRLRLVPFKHRPAKVDTTLKERLRDEYPQVLSWVIEGARAWQRDRLGTCGAVAQESRSYFEDGDAFGRWLEECCDIGPTLTSTQSVLLGSFVAWSLANHEAPTTPGEFREMVARHPGVRHRKLHGRREVVGLAVRPDPDAIAVHRARYADHDP